MLMSSSVSLNMLTFCCISPIPPPSLCVCIYVCLYIYTHTHKPSEKVGLKLNIQNMKVTASGPITSWQIDRETMETETNFIFGGSKITADSDCSYEIKRQLVLGRKAMTNLDIILKSRDITLPTKVHPVKVMLFPGVMYGYKSWTIKKVESQRIDAFELWCWRRLLRVPWTARRSNQSILKEISPEYSLERLMLKLKLQYCGHMRWRTDPVEKTLMLGKIEGRRRRGWQRMRWFGQHHWLDGHEFKQAPRVGDGQGRLVCCSPWGRKRLSDWTELNWYARTHGLFLTWCTSSLNTLCVSPRNEVIILYDHCIPLLTGNPHFFIHSSVDGQLGCFLCRGYCHQCYSEHGGACVLLNHGFLWISV